MKVCRGLSSQDNTEVWSVFTAGFAKVRYFSCLTKTIFHRTRPLRLFLFTKPNLIWKEQNSMTSRKYKTRQLFAIGKKKEFQEVFHQLKRLLSIIWLGKGSVSSCLVRKGYWSVWWWNGIFCKTKLKKNRIRTNWTHAFMSTRLNVFSSYLFSFVSTTRTFHIHWQYIYPQRSRPKAFKFSWSKIPDFLKSWIYLPADLQSLKIKVIPFLIYKLCKYILLTNFQYIFLVKHNCFLNTQLCF